jgi:hypothetical protein
MIEDHEGVGYLTWEEWRRFEWAVHDSRKLVPWLRVAGYIRGGDADEMKHRSSDHPLGLPPTWIAAEEISNLLHEINQFGDLEDVATRGHELALTLTREVETAGARWPYEDKPHRVQFVRCQACHRMSLKWMPPRDGVVVIKCADCKTVMDEATFAFIVHLMETEEHERRLGDRAAGRRTGRAGEADDLQVDSRGQGADHQADARTVA